MGEREGEELALLQPVTDTVGEADLLRVGEVEVEGQALGLLEVLGLLLAREEGLAAPVEVKLREGVRVEVLDTVAERVGTVGFLIKHRDRDTGR